MKAVLKALLLPICVFLAAMLLLADFAPLFSPSRWAFPSSVALAFPYLAFLNFAFLALWFWRGKKWWYIPLAPFVLGLGHCSSYLAFSSPDTPPDYAIKAMTFNMHYFDCLGIKEKSKRLERQDEMLDFLKKEKADVLFLQEFSGDHDAATTKRANEYLRKIYPHECDGWAGLKIFSKFPLSGCTDVKFEGTYNAFCYADANLGSRTVRLFCYHLQSIGLGHDADKILSNDKITNLDEEESQRFYKNVLGKLGKAFQKRAIQAQRLEAAIAQSPHPVLACGDLNDVPASYSYGKLGSALQDSYLAKGSGTGSTYAGRLPWLRIDYIFADPKMKVYSHRVHKNSFSDHYAVSAEVSF